MTSLNRSLLNFNNRYKMQRLKGKHKQEIQDRLIWIRSLCKDMNWKEQWVKDKEKQIRFYRDSESMIDIFYTTMTICKFRLNNQGEFVPKYSKIESEQDFEEILI